MAVNYHRYYFFIYNLLLFCISYTAGVLDCKDPVVVRGTLNNGVVTVGTDTYTERYFERFNETHFRVCICMKKACLRKCCPKGQIYYGLTCEYKELDINPKVYSEDLQWIPNYEITNFYRVYGMLCTQSFYQLNPEEYSEEVNYLIKNGSLVLPIENKIYESSLFCVEHFANKSDPLKPPELATFVCFVEDPGNSHTDTAKSIGMLISIPFLLVTFIVYSLPELRNLHGKNLMSHVASLFLAYFSVLLTQWTPYKIPAVFCISCGYLIQFFFMATFFWLNVMCFDMWSTFSGFGKFRGRIKEKENKRFLLYSLYAWGCPILLTIITVTIQYSPTPDYILKPSIGLTRCFFENEMSLFSYFYAPMGFILIWDIILFVITTLKIFMVQKETKHVFKAGKESRRNDESNKKRFILYLKLFLVMGVNWIMEVISWAFPGPKEIWILTDLMNCLQGLVIFWIFVCTKKVKNILKARICHSLVPREGETNSSSLKMSNSGNTLNQASNDISLKRTSTKKPGNSLNNGI